MSKFTDEICEVDDRAEELVMELKWMQCFLIDGERTPEGHLRAEFWSPAIERLALYAQNLPSGLDGIFVEIKNLTKKLAALREKLHPFIKNLTKKLAALREKLHPFVTHVVASSPEAHVASSSEVAPAAVKLSKEIKVAAWGGPGGQKWDCKGSLKQIVVVHGLTIDSITLTAVTPDGDSEVSAKFGGGGGDTIVQVDIDAPMEYLTGISGTYGVINSLTVITSLKFYTNRTQHGPIGSCESGDSFSCIVEDGEIVGLHGSSGIYLDSIGVYTAPK
nr:jacalin-related lectin 19-like [Ipomoea batatas]